jgi:hypothetical protein
VTQDEYTKIVENWGGVCFWIWVGLTVFLLVSWVVGKAALGLIEVK